MPYGTCHMGSTGCVRCTYAATSVWTAYDTLAQLLCKWSTLLLAAPPALRGHMQIVHVQGGLQVTTTALTTATRAVVLKEQEPIACPGNQSTSRNTSANAKECQAGGSVMPPWGEQRINCSGHQCVEFARFLPTSCNSPTKERCSAHLVSVVTQQAKSAVPSIPRRQNGSCSSTWHQQMYTGIAANKTAFC